MDQSPINITVYRWAGKFGPFRISIPCGECALTKDIIEDTLKNELSDIPVTLTWRDWLTEWWKPLIRGGWHAPIVLVNDHVISQGMAINRGILTQSVIAAYTKTASLKGNHVFGKTNCAHCNRAKTRLEQQAIPYEYHDVIHSPKALYEMIARVKPLIGPKTPITVPQIWLEDQYIGNADALETYLSSKDTTHEIRTI